MRPMKDSGVEWLGEVPQEWDVLPPKALFRPSTLKGSGGEVHLTPSQKFGVLPQTQYMEISGSRVVLQNTDSGNMKLVLPGDFISHLRSFQGGLELSHSRGKVSGAYTVLRPVKPLAGQYFKWLLKSSLYIQGLQTTTDQLRDGQTLRIEQLKLLRLPFPSLKEQAKIAAYLDQETSQIDTLISKKEQLIEKLLERRQALITQVVTKGLDPNVPMKDSGVEWLGEVPENWKIVRLARLVSFHSGRDMEKADFGPVPVYGSGGIFSWCEEPQNPSSSLSVLFGRKGTIDKPLLARGPFSCVDTMYWTSLSNDVDASFVYYLATCFPYAEIATQTALPSMTSSALKAVKVPLPNLHTQLDIIKLLDCETSQIDTLVEKTRRAIELLKERRQALITQVVTGKIDVRGFAGGNS